MPRPSNPPLRWKHGYVIATFSPPPSEVTSPLQPVVGRRGRFRHLAHGDSGDPIMTPVETWDVFPFISCPASHLVDVQPVTGPVLERRRNGRPALAETAQPS